ncbi:MAG: transposase [Candidatus Anaerobiospirillum merdipullorum]|uniref:Transposase n=1 Tax=Candidatus Anaerobiospirillum merdipullorum TaxID=2838450 RepID=A0A9E2NSL6_9GAMM|nr:transposase [Candidatus Anaerobiospirillum merdipullorum]
MELLSAYSFINNVLKTKYPWLKGTVDKYYFSHIADYIHDAYIAFLCGRSGRPRFKSKTRPIRSVTTNNSSGSSFKLDEENGTLALPYLRGEHKLKIFYHRKIQGRIVGAKIIRHACGDYYVSLYCECDRSPLPKTGRAVGLDAGFKTLISCSNGKEYPPLKALRKYERKLSRLQRSMTRKYKMAKIKAPDQEYKKSKNFLKIKAQYARLHERVRCMRSDYAHKISTELIRSYDTIVSEDLCLAGMKKSRRFSKSVSDAGICHLYRMLAYKGDWYGRTYIKVGRFFPSSQTCPQCGYQNHDLKDLKIRIWTCPQCAAVNARDISAAKSILKEGLRMLEEAAP